MIREHRNLGRFARGSVPRALVLVCVLTAGCAWQEPVAPVEPPPVPAKRQARAGQAHDARVERAVATALGQVGAPYRYGGAGPSGFDCSGLVTYAYAAAGTVLPRTTHALWRDVRRVAPGAPRRGDLVFFRIDGKLSHVGMFIGDGRFVHAPSTGSTVRIDRLDAPYYSARLAGIGRPLN